MAHSLRFYADGVNFQVVSGQSSCLAHVCLTQPPWWHVHFSVKVDSSEKDSGRLIENKDCISFLLLAPLQFSQLLFCGSTIFLIDAPCCMQVVVI